MTPITEPEQEDLGLVWVYCFHRQEVVLSIKEALAEAKAHVHSGTTLPEGATPRLVILCPSEEESVASEMRHLRALAPEAPVLLFCSPLDPWSVEEALRAGASGFIHSGMHPELIACALSAATSGLVLISRELLEACLKERASWEDPVVLTPRQREFLEVVATDVSAKEEALVPKELLGAFLAEDEAPM
jgi:DNA-binding NarL/FixJ family response regulator